MGQVCRLASLHPAFSLCPQTFKMAAVERNADDVVEAPIDDDTSEKEDAVPDLNPQSCTRE